MTDIRQQFGKKIRQLRIAKALSQEALAEAAEVSVDFLSLIERGKTSPSFKTLPRLAKALDVRMADLFDFEL